MMRKYGYCCINMTLGEGKKESEFLIFPTGIAFAECAFDEDFEAVDVHRLRDKIISTMLHSIDGRIHRSIRRHHDADRGIGFLCDFLDERHPIGYSETKIGKNHIHRNALQSGERAIKIWRHINLKISFQRVTEAVARVFLIINNQKGRRHVELVKSNAPQSAILR